MKKIVFFVLLVSLTGCSSVKSYNAHLNDLIPESKLKSDVDYTYSKLKKMHPDLYFYTSKEKLDSKFDSLKKTLNQPMTSTEFYKKINPVVYAIKQGHIFVFPPTKQYDKKEFKTFNKKGAGPLSQFEFELFNDTLYVVKNKSHNKTIVKGTPVIGINGKKTEYFINQYKNWFTSDGDNQTLKKNFLGKRFATFFTFENGFKDSLTYDFKIKDSLKTITIKRKSTDTLGSEKKEVVKKKPLDKEKIKAENRKKSIYGYNESTKLYNRNFSYKTKDSSVVVMKINGFSIGDYGTFYQESFQKIKDKNVGYLIIDLRDNGGGRLNEVADLYSYLADSTFTFLKKSKVVSKTSLFRADYFKGGGIFAKTAKIIFSPLFYGYTFFKVHKDDDGNFYYNINSKPTEISPNAFSGKVYVLINGGSFSASSLIAANLKGSKRATFVGEETGGAQNGCVAGQLPTIELPNSKIKIRVGLVAIEPYFKATTIGRGVFPDKEIIPTLNDRIEGNDPEMNWIMNDIATYKSAEELLKNNKKK